MFLLGVEESFRHLSNAISTRYHGFSEKYVEQLTNGILTCAARSFVTKVKRRDNGWVELIDEAVVTKLKKDLRSNEFYFNDPFTAEQIAKLADVASPGDNLAVVINLCATFEGYSSAYGGFGPLGKRVTLSKSEQVMKIIEKIGFEESSSFIFKEFLSLNCNISPACLLKPPPIGKYEHCLDMTTKESVVSAALHHIAFDLLTSYGINCLLLSFAGNSCRIVKDVLKKICVDSMSDLKGRFTRCDSSTHLTTFVKQISLGSGDVEKNVRSQVKIVIDVTTDVSIALHSWSGGSNSHPVMNRFLEMISRMQSFDLIRLKNCWTKP
jgi:hypothetical protein